MSELALTVHETRTTFAPGDRITGEVHLDSTERPGTLGVQLAWATEGKGDSDHGVGAKQTFDTPAAGQPKSFELTVPEGPLSYHGRLIALNWRIEAWSEGPDALETRAIVVSSLGVPMGFEQQAQT